MSDSLVVFLLGAFFTAVFCAVVFIGDALFDRVRRRAARPRNSI